MLRKKSPATDNAAEAYVLRIHAVSVFGETDSCEPRWIHEPAQHKPIAGEERPLRRLAGIRDE